MIIFVDVGNSRIKICQLSDNQQMRLSSFQSQSVSESEALRFISLHHPDKVLVSAVSNEEFCHSLQLLCERERIGFKRLMTAKCEHDVQVGYSQPTQLGIDRWMAIIGASQLSPGENLLVIDAGTATTLDLVSADKKHLGGWITPGVAMMISSLYSNTTQVDGVFSIPDNLGFADNTSDNVNHGCWAMTVAAIEFAQKQAARSNIEIDTILITGGNGKALMPYLDKNASYHQNLIFVGMSQFIDN
ncbi:type III pantothenate kinase [Thalassotalea litorea]|uniref:Type III pantothenate kinase n=1 Tax=Thalassotalea litorea TaxID=2020715 RepID=A0A5R9IGR1_9GAMM|nr:type III pantothenate kinase [Thalassotalea litorea]TLU64705.1 type III pantothenate kinase [Thalassotalea litorea]